MPTIIEKHEIQPGDINTQQHFRDAFGLLETEASARWVVMFCRSQDGWVPFTYAQIEGFCLRYGHYFFLNGLDTQGLVVLGDYGLYRVTHEFVTACFRSSPAPTVG